MHTRQTAFGEDVASAPAPVHTVSVNPRNGLAALEPWVARAIVAGCRGVDLLTFAAIGAATKAGWMAISELSTPDGLLIGFCALLAVNLLHFCGLYSASVMTAWNRSLIASVALMVVAILGVPTLWAALGGPRPDVSWHLAWTQGAAIWLVASRLAIAYGASRLARTTRLRRHVLVVGEEDRVKTVTDLLAGESLMVSVGTLDRLEDSVRESRAEDVIVALPWSDEDQMRATVAALKEFPVGIHVVPDEPRQLRNRTVALLGSAPVLTLTNRPLKGWGHFLKTAEDRVLAFVTIVMISPLLALIALAIKLDSKGPVLFRQKRYGFNNEVFTVFKFRSMHVHAPTPSLEQAKRGDPRITRVGAFLRRTSLDELPQLFNVLGGSMSLVGPRPHAIEHQTYYQTLVQEYRCRHRMRPGITGWAQVNGFRGETATVELMRKRVEYDLYYIENWSVFLDLWILFLTPFACLWGKNAY